MPAGYPGVKSSSSDVCALLKCLHVYSVSSAVKWLYVNPWLQFRFKQSKKLDSEIVLDRGTDWLVVTRVLLCKGSQDHVLAGLDSRFVLQRQSGSVR